MRGNGFDNEGFDNEVAIIGTGFSGMAAAIALDRAGISDFCLLEKAGDVGGTWRDNQYPGACCDVPSHLYSFSYEPNPDWTRRFAPAREIHAYQRHVMHAYDLCDRCRGGFDVASARWEDGGWTVSSRQGESLRTRFLVSAVGALHLPHKPDLPGLDRFEGRVMHSAEWDPDYDWRDKRAVVVGSAASAVQIVPKLAESAARVSVLQRSPNWILPRRDRAYGVFERGLLRQLPFVQTFYRWRQYQFNDLLFRGNFSRRSSLRKAWVHRLALRHLERSVPDPALRHRLTPDYPVGCKRVLFSDDYLPALQRENVELVTDGIGAFTMRGLETAAGRAIRADLVVLATGFRTTRLFGEITIDGPDGLTIEQAWAGGIRAHRSVALRDFPNLFMMYGPNSNLGHSSILVMLEAQADYLARLLHHARSRGAGRIEVKPEAEAAWNGYVQDGLAETVWTADCRSWYKDPAGRIFSLWPYSTRRFERDLRTAPLEEYTFSS